jgi:hypothetical protein
MMWKGDGQIGRLAPKDALKFVPSTAQEIDGIRNPRTFEGHQQASVFRAPGEKDWLDRLRGLEEVLLWEQFEPRFKRIS